MPVYFQDLERTGPAAQVESANDLREVLVGAADRDPFLFELWTDAGELLTVGLSSDWMCMQHSSRSGDPPYLMALNEAPAEAPEMLEFLCGGTPTPIEGKFLLPRARAELLIEEFFETRRRPHSVRWEEI